MSKSRKKSTKPKSGRSLFMKMACLCTRMYCIYRSDGLDYLKDEWVCIEHKNLSKESRLYFDTNEDCQCPYVTASLVVYYHYEEQNLPNQAKDDFMTSIDTKSQQKNNGFFGFDNTIVDLTQKRINASEGLSSSDVLGLTSEGLLVSIELQQDVDLRNILQQSVGKILKYKCKDNGVVISLAQLRR